MGSDWVRYVAGLILTHDYTAGGHIALSSEELQQLIRSHAPVIDVDKVAEKMWDNEGSDDLHPANISVVFYSKAGLKAALRKALEAK